MEIIFKNAKLGIVLWAIGLFLFVFFAFNAGILGLLISGIIVMLGSLIIFGGTGPTFSKLLLIITQVPMLLFLYYLILLATGKL